MNVFLTRLSAADEQNTGFFDGSQRLIPNNTQLEVVVTGGFFGYKSEIDAAMTAEVYLMVASKGDFYGQTYTWRPKVYDTDSRKVDVAKKNLAVIDRHLDYPIVRSGQPITAELIAQFWANKARAIALFRTNEEMLVKEGKTEAPINFVAGFKYLQRQKQEAPAVNLDAEELDGF